MIIVGTTVDDCINQFCFCVPLSNPYNIDAAISWRNNPEKFLKINEQFINNYRYTLEI